MLHVQQRYRAQQIPGWHKSHWNGSESLVFRFDKYNSATQVTQGLINDLEHQMFLTTYNIKSSLKMIVNYHADDGSCICYNLLFKKPYL